MYVSTSGGSRRNCGRGYQHYNQPSYSRVFSSTGTKASRINNFYLFIRLALVPVLVLLNTREYKGWSLTSCAKTFDTPHLGHVLQFLLPLVASAACFRLRLAMIDPVKRVQVAMEYTQTLFAT